ncbi:unnamed protein product, partial [marine sediment metagenome]
LAIPLFIFAGDLLLHGGAAQRLIDVMDAFFCHLPGGMGIATILACAFFAALSGSAGATVSAIGTIMIPAMIASGYRRGTAAGLVGSVGSIGNLIPPSIFFILYGTLVEVSISELFAAGILPGVILSAMLCATMVIAARREHYKLKIAATWQVRKDALIKSIPALVMPIIVLGGIYGGVFTPTEAAAVACVYGLVIGAFVYRKLNFKVLWSTTTHAARTTALIMLLVSMAVVLGKMFSFAGFPQAFAALVMEAKIGPQSFMMLATLVIIALGTILEALPLMYVTVPILLPA